MKKTEKKNRGTLNIPIAVIIDGQKILISQRTPDDSFGGYWEFPGGKIETGETMEQCLIREIREELGVAIEIAAKRMVITHPYPHRTIRLHCYDCRLTSGEPRAIECADWKWVLPEQLTEFLFPPASARLIQSLQRLASAEGTPPGASAHRLEKKSE
jgi:mutator protein MutT